jgi:hypothetical protein
VAVCAATGCTTEAVRTYCSRKCAARMHAQLVGAAFFARISRQGRDARRKKGTSALRRADALLMAAGRFQEAARAIYDRGYSAGWCAAKKGRRQLPARKDGVTRASHG